MNDVLQLSVIVGILTSAIRLATPYLYAAIGEAFSQRSGVVNLGVDGVMLISAYASFYVVLTPAISGWDCWPRSLWAC